MAFFMPCFRKIDRSGSVFRLWPGLAILLLTILLPSVTLASDKGYIEIESANLKQSAEGYLIDVEAEIVLNKTLQEALEKGVELFFVTRFSVMKPRWFWWDEEVARSKERIGLSYHALTRQYRLIHHTQLQGFATLTDALHALGSQYDIPVEEHVPLRQGEEHVATLQIWLDVSRLSKPFQLEWFDSKDWNLSSRKKVWEIRFPPLSDEIDEEIDD